MNGKKAKMMRQAARDITMILRGTPGTHYLWIRRMDGTIVRQLQPGCTRANYQWMKGKGHNRVYAQ